MTKDDANAIMFAYRYDNLTISESLFKQMIGDIAIMRNPWPIFSIAALSGVACLIYDHFFSYETMLLSTIQSINEQMGATILMVTHDAFTASYASRILFLQDGKIFTELHKGSDSRSAFFDKILNVLTIIGGGQSHVC